VSKTFTTWKEIADYLGKGVRTVQRWETTLDLPVRRPRSKRAKLIFALQSELDDWVLGRMTTQPTTATALERCHDSLQAAELENDQLRASARRSGR
jgi:hypothetical protein